MSQNYAQLVVVVNHLEQSTEDKDVSGGHDKGIHRVLIVDHRNGPRVLFNVRNVFITSQKLTYNFGHSLRLRMIRGHQFVLEGLNLLLVLQLVQHLKLVESEGNETFSFGDGRLLNVRVIVVSKRGE